MGKDGVPNRFVEDHDRAQSDTKPGRQCDTAPTLGEVSESEDDGDDAYGAELAFYGFEEPWE